MRALLLGFVFLAGISLADGPGSRIRADSDFPRPAVMAEKERQRCEALREEEKERCLKELRAAAAADDKRRGPEATGAGSGAGTGATSGTSGGGSFGGSAPR